MAAPQHKHSKFLQQDTLMRQAKESEDMISLDSFSKLLKLNSEDNVVVSLGEIADGEQLSLQGQRVQMKGNVSLGHKVACKTIAPGEKIIKYGVSIGSATSQIEPGHHVHVHNMQSDYTKTHVLDETKQGEFKK